MLSAISALTPLNQNNMFTAPPNSPYHSPPESLSLY